MKSCIHLKNCEALKGCGKGPYWCWWRRGRRNGAVWDAVNVIAWSGCWPRTSITRGGKTGFLDAIALLVGEDQSNVVEARPWLCDPGFGTWPRSWCACWVDLRHCTCALDKIAVTLAEPGEGSDGRAGVRGRETKEGCNGAWTAQRIHCERDNCNAHSGKFKSKSACGWPANLVALKVTK